MAKEKFTVAETDKRIPDVAKAATRSAYRRVRASGSDVVVARDGQISRIDSSGEIFFVKALEPATRIKKGTIIRIK